MLNKRNKNRNRVAIISRESDDRTLDIAMLEDELVSRGVDVETLTRLQKKELSWKALTYIGHVFKQIGAIARANVLVLDTYCIPASILPHHKNLKTIQMWHALSAVKKFGWQNVGMKDGASEKVARIMKMHAGYDFVLAPSDTTAKHFCEAFKATADKIVKMGLPRIDYILGNRTDAEATIEKIFHRYPILQEKKNIVYVPTFRRKQPTDVHSLVEAIDFEKYNLVVKLHPIDAETSERIEQPGLIYDNEFDSYDMLRIADVVISDYSSYVVEASLVDKPLHLYVYDIDEYKQRVGLNVDFTEEAIGKYAYRDAKELARAIEDKYDFAALHEFRNKYIDINTENCTGQLADFIEELLNK